MSPPCARRVACLALAAALVAGASGAGAAERKRVKRLDAPPPDRPTEARLTAPSESEIAHGGCEPDGKVECVDVTWGYPMLVPGVGYASGKRLSADLTVFWPDFPTKGDGRVGVTVGSRDVRARDRYVELAPIAAIYAPSWWISGGVGTRPGFGPYVAAHYATGILILMPYVRVAYGFSARKAEGEIGIGLKIPVKYGGSGYALIRRPKG